jgi:hypothetical protein
LVDGLVGRRISRGRSHPCCAGVRAETVVATAAGVEASVWEGVDVSTSLTMTEHKLGLNLGSRRSQREEMGR